LWAKCSKVVFEGQESDSACLARAFWIGAARRIIADQEVTIFQNPSSALSQYPDYLPAANWDNKNNLTDCRLG
jgi:hypothetical protein